MTSSVRWGIPDAVWAFVGGLAGAILAVVPFSRHDIKAETAAFLAATFIGQYGATVLVLVLVSHRKGLGSLAADFGLQLVQANLGKHILGVMVHEDEAADESELARLFDRRTREHAVNAYDLLFRPESIRARAGTGQREGFADAGPLRVGGR